VWLWLPVNDITKPSLATGLEPEMIALQTLLTPSIKCKSKGGGFQTITTPSLERELKGVTFDLPVLPKPKQP
jgi:hypothetical protein